MSGLYGGWLYTSKLNSCRRCVGHRAVYSCRPGTADDEFRSALSWPSLCNRPGYWIRDVIEGGCQSPNIAPKPTDQSCSNSVSRVPLQTSPACLFVFELPSKLRVVHIRKKFKILVFSKMTLTILIKFCGFIVHSNLNNTALSAFPEKNPWNWEKS